jgi:hypothetical protein
MPVVRVVPKSADASAKSPGNKTLIPLKADASAERVSGRNGTKGAAENDTGRPNTRASPHKVDTRFAVEPFLTGASTGKHASVHEARRIAVRPNEVPAAFFCACPCHHCVAVWPCVRISVSRELGN